MATKINFESVQQVVETAKNFLSEVQGAAPILVDAAKGLVDQAKSIVETVKGGLDELIHPTMTPAETAAALDQMQVDLDGALAVVKGLVPPSRT